VLSALGQDGETAAATALELTTDPAVRAFLTRQFARFRASAPPPAGS
jgi:spore coat protein CotF